MPDLWIYSQKILERPKFKFFSKHRHLKISEKIYCFAVAMKYEIWITIYEVSCIWKNIWPYLVYIDHIEFLDVDDEFF